MRVSIKNQNMENKIILLSIHPKYAKKISDGTKRIEIRRVKPKYLNPTSIVILYVTSPEKKIMGAFRVKEIINKAPDELWKDVHETAGISYNDFNDYLQGVAVAVGIRFTEYWCSDQELTLKTIRDKITNFVTPQGFRYLTIEESLFFKSMKLI